MEFPLLVRSGDFSFLCPVEQGFFGFWFFSGGDSGPSYRTWHAVESFNLGYPFNAKLRWDHARVKLRSFSERDSQHSASIRMPERQLAVHLEKNIKI